MNYRIAIVPILIVAIVGIAVFILQQRQEKVQEKVTPESTDFFIVDYNDSVQEGAETGRE